MAQLGSVFPHSRISRTYEGKQYIFASYSHLQWPRIICLEKSGWTIGISKRLTFTWNIAVCVCVCVFSVYLIIVFSTFHSRFLPLPVTHQQILYQHTHLWCILGCLCLQALDSQWQGEMEGTERGEAREGGTKKGWQSEWLFSHAEWVECQNRTEVQQRHEGLNAQRDSMFHIACTDRREQTEREGSHKGNVVWKKHVGTGGSRKHHHSGKRHAAMDNKTNIV